MTSWTEKHWTAYINRIQKRMLAEELEKTTGKRGKINHVLRNVRFCTDTGYHIPPESQGLIYHSKCFLLAYDAVPFEEFDIDYINPEDPRSIVCDCCSCHSIDHSPDEKRKTIVTCAEPVPGLPKQEDNTCTTTLDIPRMPVAYWPKEQNVKDGFTFRWTMFEKGERAPVSDYEVYMYREIPDKKWVDAPWKVYEVTKNKYVDSIQFDYGGYYHFTVRAKNSLGIYGHFSKPITLFLTAHDRTECDCNRAMSETV